MGPFFCNNGGALIIRIGLRASSKSSCNKEPEGIMLIILQASVVYRSEENLHFVVRNPKPKGLNPER